MAQKEFSSARNSWDRFVKRYTEIFSLALKTLSCTSCDLYDENKISEALCPILNRICYEKSHEKNYEIRTPSWEQPIQPVSIDEIKESISGKRPDFTCKFVNPFAMEHEAYEIPLHVECKRLGRSANKNWDLNKNYVVNGIMRFDSIIHEYGKRADSGIMIGYIVNLSHEIILQEVNAHQNIHCNNNPNIIFDIIINDVLYHRQKLNRINIWPIEFDLIHLWVDLKK